MLAFYYCFFILFIVDTVWAACRPDSTVADQLDCYFNLVGAINDVPITCASGFASQVRTCDDSGVVAPGSSSCIGDGIQLTTACQHVTECDNK